MFILQVRELSQGEKMRALRMNIFQEARIPDAINCRTGK